MDELIRKCHNQLKLKEITPISSASQQLLANFYTILKGPMGDQFRKNPKNEKILHSPPLIVSFHPKLTLLNNNVHESLLAVRLADALGHVPVWIPYVYDTATHSAVEGGKIRAPTYAYVEGKFLTLRAAAKIRGNIINTEKPVTTMEIDQFFQEFSDLLTYQLGVLQNHLNTYNFGHVLFDLKQRVMQFGQKKLLNEIAELKTLILDAVIGTKNLGESLAMISYHLLDRLGIPINIGIIEPLLPDFVETIFSQIVITPQVKKDPSLLEGLFLHYEMKEKLRIPIVYTGTNFLAMTENATRIFEGNLHSLTEGLKEGWILPTGSLLILIFAAMGCRITLGGLHTQEYYPDYLNNANRLLANTSFAPQMQVIGYGDIRHLDNRSFLDILAASRILEKVGSRTIVSKKQLVIPHDIVDHLNFLAGKSAIPIEYIHVIESICSNESSSNSDKTSLQKELDRFTLIDGFNKIPLNDLPTHISEFKPYFRTLPLESLHSERIKVAIETLWEDSKMRVEKMRENIALEQHLLGGHLPKNPKDISIQDENICEDESPVQEIYDGLLIRSKRIPTLLDLVFYGSELNLSFQEPIQIIETKVPHFLFLLAPKEMVAQTKLPSIRFTDYSQAFNFLIPPELLPKFLRSNRIQKAKKKR